MDGVNDGEMLTDGAASTDGANEGAIDTEGEVATEGEMDTEGEVDGSVEVEGIMLLASSLPIPSIPIPAKSMYNCGGWLLSLLKNRSPPFGCCGPRLAIMIKNWSLSGWLSYSNDVTSISMTVVSDDTSNVGPSTTSRSSSSGGLNIFPWNDSIASSAYLSGFNRSTVYVALPPF